MEGTTCARDTAVLNLNKRGKDILGFFTPFYGLKYSVDGFLMPRHVLILEDSRTQAIIISKMFQKAGYESTCVVTAEEAVTQLKSRPFDLLVLDVFIESRNTLDDLQAYRDLAGDVPIAIMTAGQIDNPEAGAAALNKARRARVDFLLPKPFYFDDVKQICEDVDAFWARSQATEAVAS